VNDSNRLGDLAEYYAVTWLWDQGYEVFRNCGCTGAIDLIAMDKEGKIILIDVKTMNIVAEKGVYRIGTKRSDRQKELGVQFLGFIEETRQLRFIEHHDETTYTGHRNEQHPQQDLVLCDPES
jgi:Holliday junction resolvase-like predicted endonuclease